MNFLTRAEITKTESDGQLHFPVYIPNKFAPGSMLYGHSSGLTALNLTETHTTEAPLPKA